MTNYDDHIALMPWGEDFLLIITEVFAPEAMILARNLCTTFTPAQVTIRTFNPHLN